MENAPRNRILKTLDTETRQHVLEICEPVWLESQTVLSRVGQEQRVVHFPEDCVISTVASFSDGSDIEVANIGLEGCTGVGPTLDSKRQLNTDIVQVSGKAHVMDIQDFMSAKESTPEFQRVLNAALRGMFHQIMISGACNATHSAQKRLARWLVTMSDRTPGRTIKLTQEFLAQILGVRRATVSEASSYFKHKQLIDYKRGKLVILDHTGLRNESCECYRLVAEAYDQFLPVGSH